MLKGEIRKLEKMIAEYVRDTTAMNNPQQKELRRCLNAGFDVYSTEYLKAFPTPAQSEIARLAETPPYQVLIPSANNQGKTWFLSAYARYFYEKYDPSITLVTATTAAQVKDAVFRELRTSTPQLSGFQPNATRVESSPDHYIHGFTTANPDAFQGRHELNLALLFDEATGIDIEFMRRGRTMFGKHEGHVWICAYNPNDPSTWPYTEEESGLWHVVRLSALEHPNVIAELQGLPPLIPSAVRLATVWDRLVTECEIVVASVGEFERQLCFEFPLGSGFWWRPKTAAFEAQVLGRWPLTPTESILSPAMVDRCLRLHLPLNDDWQLQIGCDVARFGNDKTAIVVRRGPCVLHAEAFAKRDSVYIIQRLQQVVDKYALDDEKRNVPICIDDTGGYGGGVIDHMTGYNVVGINMASRSPSPLRTVNMRSHLWFQLSEYIIAEKLDLTRIAPDMMAALRRELSAPRYRIDEVGRKRLEAKLHTRERLKASPDVADALTLAFHKVD